MKHYYGSGEPLISAEKADELRESLYGAVDSRWFSVSGLVDEDVLAAMQAQAAQLRQTQPLHTIRQPDYDAGRYRACRQELKLPQDNVQIAGRGSLFFALAEEARQLVYGSQSFGALVYYEPSTMAPKHFDSKESDHKLKLTTAVNITGRGAAGIYSPDEGTAYVPLGPGDMFGLLSVNPPGDDFKSLDHRVINASTDARVANTISIYV